MNVATREEIIEQQGSIDNLDSFLQWVKSGTKARLKNQTFILEIQEKINGKDPVVYINELYYNETKSLQEILKSLEVLGVKSISKATLHRLLFIHFGWVPRQNTERTPVHEQQLSKKTQSEVAEFESKVSGLIGGRVIPRDFKLDEFHSKRYRMGKALYILKTLGRVDKNILYSLSIEGGLSNAILATSLNNELQSVLKNNPEYGIDFESVKLYPQSISRWFKYNAVKLKAA